MQYWKGAPSEQVQEEAGEALEMEPVTQTAALEFENDTEQEKSLSDLY